MSLILWCLLAAAVGASIAGLAVAIVGARRRARLVEELATLRGEKAVAEARLSDLRAQVETQQAWITDKTRQFEQSMRLAAQQVMEERGHVLNESSRKEVEAVVGRSASSWPTSDAASTRSTASKRGLAVRSTRRSSSSRR